MEPMATNPSRVTGRQIQPAAGAETVDYRSSLGSHRSLDTMPIHITNTHAPSPENRSGDAPALMASSARALATSPSVLVRASPTSPTADFACEDDHRIGLHDTHEMGRSRSSGAPRFVRDAAPCSYTTRTSASSDAERQSDHHGRRGARTAQPQSRKVATLRPMTWQGFRIEKPANERRGEEATLLALSHAAFGLSRCHALLRRDTL